MTAGEKALTSKEKNKVGQQRMQNPDAATAQEAQLMIKRLFTVAEILSRAKKNDKSSKNRAQNQGEKHELENLRYCEEHRNLKDA